MFNKATTVLLSEEARKARNEYHREWSRNNKEKVKAINKAYWERKAKSEEKQNELMKDK